MEISELSVFIIGCGSIGKRHAQVLRDLGIVKFYFYDSNPNSALQLSDHIGGEAVASLESGFLKRPDIAYILSPTSLHIPQAISALKSGCHVFIEKPLSVSLDRLDELKRARDESGKVVAVGFCFRFHEGIVKAKRLVEDGAIGKIVSIRALMGEHFPDVRPDYKDTYYVKYSGAFELIHDLDLALWFACNTPQKVYGVYGSFAELGFESPDTVEILLGFADMTASIHLDFFQSPRRRQFEVLGTLGTIIVEFSCWDSYELSIFSRAGNEWSRQRESTTRDAMFSAESKEFLSAITDFAPITCGIEDAQKSLEVFCNLYS